MSESSSICDDAPVRRGSIAVVLRGDRFLVIRRSATVLAPLQYCFPGGGIEGEETEAEALVRELQEELGVAIRPVRRVWQNVTRWRVDLAWWLGELPDDIEFVVNPAEVESVHWMTIAEMQSLPELMESNRAFLQALAEGVILLASRPDTCG